jgi:hypothetical protein
MVQFWKRFHPATKRTSRTSLIGSLTVACVTLICLTAHAASPLAELDNYLKTPAAERTPIAESPLDKLELSREDAQLTKEKLWEDLQDRIRAERAPEMEAKRIKLGELEMPFDYKIFGDKPEGGRSLYISMHGGGNAPPRVNDQQWENQKRLYEPEEGVYVAPRAPTNTWNLWHEAHIDAFFARLIANMIVFEDVNPDRVYIMGYSAGGDGVFQLAPRMADSLAAAAMMAGHPNETTPEGLRNIGFTLHMGGKDAAFKRNDVARQWKTKLADLQAADPQGYQHLVEIHEDKGHWMDRQDAVAVPWMAKFTRTPHPTRIVWKQDDVTHRQFYWIGMPQPQAGVIVRADRDGQTISLASSAAIELEVYLNDDLVDLDQPVRIVQGSTVLFEGQAPRRVASIAQSLENRADPRLVFSAVVPVAVQPSE